MPGAISRSISSHLPAIDASKLVKPVMLAPGCAMLATSPLPSGSETWTKTIGIVSVALCRASPLGVVCATITSGESATSSLARAATRSELPAAQRWSMRRLRPLTHPKACRPSCSPATINCAPLLDHLVGGSNCEKVPFAWHTLESMHAPVLECDAGADDQVLHGA